MPGFPPFSFPPRKRGPRNRGGAVATKRTSAQRAFRQHDARVLLKTSTLRAAEAVVVRCPFSCHPVFRGPWIPAFAGKTKSCQPVVRAPWALAFCRGGKRRGR